MTNRTRQSGSSDLSAFVSQQFPERGIRPDDVIVESWLRSVREYRINPDSHGVQNVLTAQEIRAHLVEHQQYLDIACQAVTGLGQRVAKAGFAVLLSDEKGVTLDTRLPGQDELYTRSGLLVGSCWDESLVGTNGIGTTLVAARPLTIHRQEHFLTDNFRLSCSVSPIFDAQNRLRGCLNATCLNSNGPKELQHLTLHLVTMYARLIENAHFHQLYRKGMTLTIKPRDVIPDLVNEQLLALDENGRVIGANRAAFIAHDAVDHELLGCSIESVLSVSVSELLTLANGGAKEVLLRGPDGVGILEVSLRAPVVTQAPAVSKVLKPTAHNAHPDLDQLSGADPVLQKAVGRIRKVIDKDIAILLTGETGTGKEAFSRAIHEASRRRSGPFVALNCASIPESLIESELFGYRGGSFTGANKKGMKGKLELANGGTLFLDEIGDMPAHLQTRLLRVLAEREIHPLGAEAPIALDVQVISATHQDLSSMLVSKQFREDLFYRLSGMTLRLPALRERADCQQLIADMLKALPGSDQFQLSGEASRLLLGYAWPGNIRQLLSALRYAAAMAEDGYIDIDCLPGEVQAGAAGALAAKVVENAERAGPQLEVAEPQQLYAMLRQHRWNISSAAQAIGISRSTLYRKMKLYGIVQPNEQF